MHARDWTQVQNQMRFLVTDLILGRVNQDHPLYAYFCANGVSKPELRWFERNPARIDVLALDYYAHSEMQWSCDGNDMTAVSPSLAPRGFAAVALDYVERYGLPIMLGETNIRGSIEDRISWLKLTYSESEKLSRQDGVDFRAYGWFPLWDSCAWAHDLCRTAKTETDPVGIYALDRSRRTRMPSELSDIFTRLVRGQASADDIPAYRFQPPWAELLRGYMPFTDVWHWRDHIKTAA